MLTTKNIVSFFCLNFFAMVPDITLLTKVRVVKAMFFPEVTYRCDSWTMKKAECQRTDAFKSLVSFPYGSAGKASTCNVGDLGLIPGLGRSPREEKGYPLQYNLDNSV